MQLKRLEAYGFKSFADKIEIEFDKGITAIVGPNGSGKSNITDAIRWVLGEQSVRNLRATKSEDIIFAGSATRHALGVAEVSLLFANDGTLPVDFDEVMITRRLYRSGESEYYINRSRCRLKDIYNLFADTGIGHDGMSIIGQNRIDDILNARPEERRAFFEETAGITKYRNRKKESTRKLEDTAANLVRVEDIMHEIENQLEPLSKQAQRTKIYNELAEEQKQCQLTKIVHDCSQQTQAAAENKSQLTAARDDETQAETQLTRLRARKEEIAKRALDLENRLSEQGTANEKLRQKLSAIEQEMATLTERQEQSSSADERLQAQHQALEHEIAQALAAIARMHTQEDEQQKALEAVASDLQAEKLEAQQYDSRLVAQKEREAEAQNQKEAASAELAQRQQELAVLERDLQAGDEGREERETALENARTELERLTGLAAKLEQELQHTVAEAQGNETLLQTAQQTAAKAHAAATAAQRESQGSEQQSRDLASKIQFLTRMQQSYEGFGRSTKAVLKASEPWRAGVAGAVAELIDVPREYVVAIETALGGSIQNVVTDDTDTAKGAIDFLKRTHSGRVTFLPLSTIVGRTPDNLDLAQLQRQGAIDWGNRLVKCEPRYQKVADHLLARTLVVDTLDHALAIARAQHYRLRIVTQTGELLSPGGSLAGGSHQRREASYLSRSGEIAGLQEKLTAVRQQQAQLTEAYQQAAAQAAEADQAVNQARNAVQQARVHQAELRAGHERLAENVRTQRDAVSLQEQAAVQQRESFAAAQNKRTSMLRQVTEAEKNLKLADKAAAELAQETVAMEQENTALAARIHEKELQQAVLEQEVLRSREGIKLHTQTKEKAEASLLANEKEAEDLQVQVQTSDKRLQELEQEQATLSTEFDNGLAEYDDIKKQRMDCYEDSQAADKDMHTGTAELAKIQQRIHQLELAGQKINLALSDWQDKLLSEYGLTLEKAGEYALDAAPEEVNRRLRQLNAEIEKLGPVNPNALQEYEELNQRYEFMQKQSNDLIEAKENLEHLISDMDASMTEQFTAAFADIQKYFGEIFVRLFGGGKAELKLTDTDNVLESGVDILVTLPKKKRQNLSALSGGERALTVIALLFSFLKYRPSPFSVLDEIDAPLDEANVNRFGKFLREFAHSTQFIVVTHRKGTMEAVDTMYGVTVEDAGVSRIISVKIDELEKLKGKGA